MKLTDFKALTFDCYGTLIDWEAGMIAALEPLTRRASRKLSRDAILEAHARHESAAAGANPGEALSRPSADRLSPAGGGMGRQRELERVRGLRPLGERLAAVRRHHRRA